MNISDLDPETRINLLNRLQTTYDSTILEEEFNISIPQWLTIKYKCISCTEQTRMRIQVKNIPKANRELTCPFCRRVSQMNDIHVGKESTDLSEMDFSTSHQLGSSPLQFD